MLLFSLMNDCFFKPYGLGEVFLQRYDILRLNYAAQRKNMIMCYAGIANNHEFVLWILFSADKKCIC
jgi:hypothetical protein